MKKFFNKIPSTIAFLVLILTGVGCDEDVIIYDVDNGQALYAFNTVNQTLPVPDTGATAFVEVGVTTRADFDRRINISIDAEQTTAAPDSYSIEQSSLFIPAGEFVGLVEVRANFNAIPETGQTSLVLNLENVEGDNAISGSRLSHRINFFRFCPFEGNATFLGAYRLETVALGIFNTPTLTDGIVNVTQGPTVADRQFSVSAYPAFGNFPAFNFQFSLICGEVIVPNDQLLGVGCSGSNSIGTPQVNATYDPADDSVITINITDDIRNQCGVGSPQASFRLIKQ